jgi:predicted ATPase
LPATENGVLPEDNLPAQLTPFIGREEELTHLAVLLGDHETRLITLVGPGGIGKTRLALHAASSWLHQNPDSVPDGVYFLSLSAIEEARDVVGTLAELLGVAPGAEATNAPRRLARSLRSRHMLLLLDNAEHLAGPHFSAWLDVLLREAPGISVLATSRTALELRGEQLFWVGGLQLPQEPPEEQQIPSPALASASSAVSLFLQTARRNNRAFELTSENAATIIAICQAVAAMPLGIELAAAWMGILSPLELLEELERTPDILASAAGNVPAGQRSLRAVFDTSWKLLSASEQEAVRALSIFRGGFTRAAAGAVGELSLPTLLALVNKCWLQRSDGDRLSMHELLSRYGVEALGRNPDQFASILLRHSLYYCHWLEEQYVALCGPEQRAAQRAIAAELANIRLACHTAIAMAQTEELARAVHPLGQFFRWTGRFVEGDTLFQALLQELDESSETPQSVQKLRVRLLVWRVVLRSFLGVSEASEDLALQADAELEQLQRVGEAMLLERLYITMERGYNRLLRQRRPQDALTYFSDALALAQKVGSPWEEGLALLALARAQRNLGQLDEAERSVVKGIELLSQHGSEATLAEAAALRGNILMRLGRLQEAEALLAAGSELATAHPEIEAYRLVNLGWARLLLGQFDRAEQPLTRGIAKYGELGSAWATLWTGHLCAVMLHQGRYQAAMESAESALVPSRAPASMAEVQAGHAFVLGAASLAMQQWVAARTDLERSVAVRPWAVQCGQAFPNASLALAVRVSGEHALVWQRVAEELEMACKSHSYPALILSLLAAALLSADRGEGERAAAIHARVWQEPYAHNSVWLWDVAGRELDALMARLPEAVRQTAAKRYEGVALWQIAAELAEDPPI